MRYGGDRTDYLGGSAAAPNVDPKRPATLTLSSMRKKRPWRTPWRREVTPEEAAERARMLHEWLRDKPHAPRDPAAREKVVGDLFEVIQKGPPVELPEHSS